MFPFDRTAIRGRDLSQIKCKESKMAALVATAPLALIVFLMAALRWSAANAGLVGLVAAAVGAIGFFGFGTSVHVEQGITGALRGDRCHPDGVDKSVLGQDLACHHHRLVLCVVHGRRGGVRHTYRSGC